MWESPKCGTPLNAELPYMWDSPVSGTPRPGGDGCVEAYAFTASDRGCTVNQTHSRHPIVDAL
eukprot:scaffold18743_cov107-Isochrysis_galbana.AAC.1